MTPTVPITLAQESLKRYFFSTTGASRQAADTETLFMYIMWVNIISFIMLMVLLGWFVFKYHRRKQAANYQVSAAHHTPLELTWSIVPLLIMVPIFYWGFTGYADKLAAPSDSEDISITGTRWNWTVTYRNGAQPQGDPVRLTETGHDVPEFVVPLRRPVRLILHSTDVIHAFYIPDFRTKMDVIPNRYTSMWFFPEKATNDLDPKTGKGVDPTQPVNPPHKVFCAEYCGQDHSEMGAQMRVVPLDQYEKTIREWTDYPKNTPILKVGEIVWSRKGCNSCHTVDGKDSTGPTWKDMYGEYHDYTNGETHKLVDENWLRENILYSQKRILKDPKKGAYPTSMPVFAGQLNPLELDAVIFYIKSLSKNHTAEDLKGSEKTVKERREAENNAAGAASGATAPGGGGK